MNDENIRSYAAWARGKAVSKKVDENCKAIQIFKVYSQKLDERKDRFDRLFKVNKDITTKSKNVISLLHRISR